MLQFDTSPATIPDVAIPRTGAIGPRPHEAGVSKEERRKPAALREPRAMEAAEPCVQTLPGVAVVTLGHVFDIT